MVTSGAFQQNLVLTEFVAEFDYYERLHDSALYINPVPGYSLIFWQSNRRTEADAPENVVVGRVVLDGDTDKELCGKYLMGTVTSMAELDDVHLPYEFVEKLQHLLDSIPADEFEGALDDVVAEL